MSSAATAPARPAASRVTKKSWWWLTASPPATAAPMPQKANCPSETCPAQPLRITTEIPTMAKITTSEAKLARRGPTTSGRRRSTPATAARSPIRPRRTSGSERSSSGIGRNSRRVRKLDTPVSNARLTVPRRSSSAPRMIGSMSAALRSGCEVPKKALWSMTPMPIPASSASGRLSIPATTAAASP